MGKYEEKYDKARCNLTIPVEIVEEVDKLAKQYGATRSVMVTFMIKQYLDQQAVVELTRHMPNTK